mmetsp:Transcript_8673/g.20968  ORF Transcript_8673/g.20968 Transcript_8673/m.20968 type:complete len:225 (-) Transcript_8673:2074-2748(-)
MGALVVTILCSSCSDDANIRRGSGFVDLIPFRRKRVGRESQVTVLVEPRPQVRFRERCDQNPLPYVELVLPRLQRPSTVRFLPKAVQRASTFLLPLLLFAAPSPRRSRPARSRGGPQMIAPDPPPNIVVSRREAVVLYQVRLLDVLLRQVPPRAHPDRCPVLGQRVLQDFVHKWRLPLVPNPPLLLLVHGLQELGDTQSRVPALRVRREGFVLNAVFFAAARRS